MAFVRSTHLQAVQLAAFGRMMKVSKDPAETAQHAAMLRLQLGAKAFRHPHDEREVSCRRIETYQIGPGVAIQRGRLEKPAQCIAELQRLLMIAPTEPNGSLKQPVGMHPRLKRRYACDLVSGHMRHPTLHESA